MRLAARGFTLVEFIAVMAVTGILATFVWRHISMPIRSFVELDRRAGLVDQAETALSRMTRELRLALPNSVRIAATGNALEFLRTSSGGRYRRVPDPADPLSDALDFAALADSFHYLGPLAGASQAVAGAGGRGDCLAGNADCVVVFNTGAPSDCALGTIGQRTNAYCGDNIAGLAILDTTAALIGFDRSDGGTPFPYPSPYQRFHIVDTPVTFMCVGGVLYRYDNYPIAATQIAPPGGSAQQLANKVQSCQFSYEPGTASRAGLVTMRVVFVDQNVDGNDETVSLLQQVHVSNAP